MRTDPRDEDRATAGRNVYARNFGIDAAAAEALLTARAGAQYAREAPGCWTLTVRPRARKRGVITIGQHVT